MKKHFLLCVLICAFSFSKAQDTQADSLLKFVATSKEDTNKVNTLNKLSEQFDINGDFAKSKRYADDALTLSKKLGFKKGEATAYINLRFLYKDQGNYPEALKNDIAALKIYLVLRNKSAIINAYMRIGILNEAMANYSEALKNYFYSLEESKKNNDKKSMANVYGNIGVIYDDQSNYSEALKNYSEAIKIQQEIKDEPGMAKSYINIGIVYEEQGNYPESQKSYLSALKIYEATGDKQGQSNVYNNIGIIYENQNDLSEALKNFLASIKINEEIGNKVGAADSYINLGNVYYRQQKYQEALKNYSIALKLEEEIGNKQMISGCYNNIGQVYTVAGNYPEALKNYHLALKMREDTGDKQGIAESYLNLGFINIKLKKAAESKTCLLKSLALAKEIGQKEYIEESCNGIAKADSALGNYKEAFNYYKQFILYRDSLYNEANTKKTVQQQMQYAFDKKQSADSLKINEERHINEVKFEQERTQRYGLYGGLMLVLVFSGIMYNRFKVTQKQKQIIEIKEQETKKQNQVISEQKHIVEEKNKEITDSISYAKRLQEAILPPLSYIDKYLSDNFILYKPKDIVAGDFYWAEYLDGLFFIAAADSTGHGVPGAMVSVVCSNALNRSVKEFKITDTGKILDKTRDLVLETFSKGSNEVKDGMDISLLCIDSRNKKVFWSGANNSLWFTENDRMVEIKADKEPIGKTENPKPFRTHQLEYKAGTIFYLFTDGYADQFGGPNGKKFKSRQLGDLLCHNTQLSLDQQKQLLDATFETWRGDLEQVDDVTLIALKI